SPAPTTPPLAGTPPRARAPVAPLPGASPLPTDAGDEGATPPGTPRAPSKFLVVGRATAEGATAGQARLASRLVGGSNPGSLERARKLEAAHLYLAAGRYAEA